MLLSQRDFIGNQRRSGAIPNGVSALLLDELEDQIRELRGYNTEQLVLDPRELLLKVPAFSELPAEEIPKILSCLRQRTLPARQDLIQHGSRDGSLYIIARGKVRVLRIDGELTETITELGSGEFVGKGGLADREPHKATSRALTPCAVYELRRGDLDRLLESCPGLAEGLERTLRKRRGRPAESLG